MRGRRDLKSMFADPRIKELIDSLWREYPGLYNEKYNRQVGEFVEGGEVGELDEPWLLNIFGSDLEFGQALGQDHFIHGNQSTAIGIGGITRAFREIVMGSYLRKILLQTLMNGSNLTAWSPSEKELMTRTGKMH